MLAGLYSKLLYSIRNEDFLILCFAMAALVAFFLSFILSVSIKCRVKGWSVVRETNFSKWLGRVLNFCYTVFLTILSLFPLLGMLGTVAALLGLDMSAGDMENIKNNFFNALTSTAWGIIFSVIGKSVNALFENFIEAQIEAAKTLSFEIKTKSKKAKHMEGRR